MSKLIKMKKIIILLVFIVTVVSNAFACYPDGITFSNQREVDAFYYESGAPYTDHCQWIEGDAIIEGNDITNLDGFARLQKISGSLTIKNCPNLTSIYGLRKLESIEGSFIFNNNDALANFNGLHSLTEISDNLEIKDNDNLKILHGWSAFFGYTDGLKNVSSVGGDVILSNNPLLENLDGLIGLTVFNSLFKVNDCSGLLNVGGLKNIESIGGDFIFDDNDAIANFYGLSSVTEIGGELKIVNNDNLQILHGWSAFFGYTDGLKNVASIGGSIIVESNSALTNFDGLSGVNSINGNLSIRYNSSLAHISGLSGLSSGVDVLRIVDDPLLQNLNGLQGISSTSFGILIDNNSSLMNLNGLDNLTSVGHNLLIWNNSSLQNINALENVTSVGGDFQVKSNSVLQNLTGLDKLQTINGDFDVSNNNSLNSLSALENLISISGDLHIDSNPSLTSLAGIDNIDYTSITFLSLRSDNQLTTCDVLSICDYLNNGGSATILGNATNCNSIAEVEESCSPPSCTTLNSPYDGESGVLLDKELSWSSVASATGYKITISTSSENNGELVKNKDIGNTTSYSHTSDFPCKTTLYVQLVPYNNHGDKLDCSITNFITIGVGIESTTDKESCPKEGVQLDINGTTISWSPEDDLDDPHSFHPIASPYSTTTYTATVSDEHGCTASDSITIYVHSITALISGFDTLCPDVCDGYVTSWAEEDEGEPFTYSWNTGDTTHNLTQICAGTYIVTITNSYGCSDNNQWSIAEYEPITMTIDEKKDVTDDSKGFIHITIDNNSRPYKIEWFIGYDLFSVEEDIDSLEAGCYNLLVTVPGTSCTLTKEICIEDKTTGLNEIGKNENFVKIYPIPATNKVFIKTFNNGKVIKSMKIIDVSGKTKLDKIDSDAEIDISSMKNGLYFLKIEMLKGSIYKKILVVR